MLPLVLAHPPLPPHRHCGIQRRASTRSRVQLLRATEPHLQASPTSALPLSAPDEVLQLRRTVEHLKSLNADLQSEIAQVVRSLSQALDSLPQQLEPSSSEAAGGEGTGATAPEPPCSPVYHQPPDVAQARLSCSVPHPGALCCTKTSMSQADGTFVVNMSTTARTTRGHLSSKDLAAIGARALECAAVDFSRGRSAEAQAVVLPGARLARHAAICSILQEGRVITADRNPITSTYGHESFVLELQHPTSGQRLKALFKPRVAGHASGWHRAPIEVVAYRLNLLLGFDYVPPAVYRTGGLHLQLNDGWVEFDEGAMLLWVDAAEPMEEMPAAADAFLSDTRILDVLIHNSDRHRGHFLTGRHWAEEDAGPGGAPQQRCPVLIDHAAGFRKEAYVIMDHENAFCTGPVRRVKASTYLRLRLLDRATCCTQFGDYLSEQELREMLHRRNYILRYLDDLVAKQGFEATVLE